MSQAPRKDEFTGFPETEGIGCEMALVGALITNPLKCIDAVRDAVNGSEFFNPSLGALFDAVILLHDNGTPVSEAGLLLAGLRSMKGLNVPSDMLSMKPEGIPKLVESGANWWHAKHYADTVREAYKLRKLLLVSSQVAVQVRSRGAVSVEIAEWLQAELDGTKNMPEASIVTIGQAARQAIAELRDTAKPKRCLLTGVETLDELAALLMPGELVVLAARPGNGKTSFAQQVGIHNASNGRHVLFASIEMETNEVGRRELSAATGIPDDDMRRGDVDAQDLACLDDAATKIDALAMTIYRPKKKPTTRQIRAVAKSAKRTGRCDLLIVDYIGEVSPADHRKPRHEQVAQIASDLKEIAVELTVPVLALCQLNRDAEKERPTMANLRESGAIEQVANAVMFLHRDTTPNSQLVELILEKNRHGRRGAIWLRFDGVRTRFYPSDPPQFSEPVPVDKFNSFKRRKQAEPKPPRNELMDHWNDGGSYGDRD